MMLRTMSNRGGNIWLPRYASMAQGATIQQLFAALPAGTPGDCWLLQPPYCWQNTARTTPATAAGDPIRYVDSAAGRSGALQALSDAARPALQTFPGSAALGARFDGIDDALQSVAALDMSSTNQVTVIAVVRSLASATGQIMFELGVGELTGKFDLQRSGQTYVFRSAGTQSSLSASVNFAEPDNAILVMEARISTNSLIGRRNGVQVVNSAASQGAGNYLSRNLYIGARNSVSNHYHGHIAALCAFGLQPSSLPAEWVETMTGLLLPPGAVFS